MPSSWGQNKPIRRSPKEEMFWYLEGHWRGKTQHQWRFEGTRVVGGGPLGAWRRGTACGPWGSSGWGRWETKPAPLPPASEWTPGNKWKQELVKSGKSSSEMQKWRNWKSYMAIWADKKLSGGGGGNIFFFTTYKEETILNWLTSCIFLLYRRKCSLWGLQAGGAQGKHCQE